MEETRAGSPVAAVVPSLNPTRQLTGTVEGLLAAGFARVILVNDGSRPETEEYFQELDRLPQVTLLTHPVNRGKGAAMKTAFTWLLEHWPDCPGVVTVDGDGQHHPEDALACAQKMLEEERVILGCRDFSRPEVPPAPGWATGSPGGCFGCSAACPSPTPRPACGPSPAGIWRSSPPWPGTGMSMRPTCCWP